MNIRVLKNNKVGFAISVSILLISYFAWAKLTSPLGDQKVSYTPSKKECFSISGSRPWKYCVHIPANAHVNGSIAYLLHGRNLDEQVWNDDTFYTAMIQRYWEDKKVTPPTVVTVSFGPIWLLTPKGKTAKSGLSEIFENEVIPEVERRVGKPKSRIIFGESMGGLNSLLISLRNPSLFQKVASLCPPVYSGSPFAPLSEIQAFLKRTGADPKAVYGVIQLAKDYFADEDEWNQASPLKKIERIDPKSSLEIYLSCGLYDIYGNFEGSESFAELAQSRGIKIHWRPIYGGHCATDVSSLAEFLIE